ncbi:glycoside hydrolase superfamily [Phaeosphaeria sp. MPI-PUGE-AT-0046c]|nr:glycoside hydrolase superfamily [Phaeosphaeria sp. MPI-PUGE-AT-0046c]
MARHHRSGRKQNVFTTFLFATTAIASAVNMPATKSLARSETECLPYKNASLSVDERVKDLVDRMTIEEKAGQLFRYIINSGPNGTITNTTVQMVKGKLLTHFNLHGSIDSVRNYAEWYNKLQELALENRLGIPITLSSDPRHAFTNNVGTGFVAESFSQWPESLGLAAIRDAKLVEEFANIARQEYMAIGLRSSLHPQIDLATEPRWARIGGTMGENANLTAELVVSYLKGFTHGEFGTQSVTTVTKHFPGSGPVEGGEDSHFTYGKNATYPGNNFEYHLIPFKAAIAAGARQMMPYYSRPMGTKYEEVASGMNKGLITDLLKHELGFKGIVVSDWGLITDGNILGQDMPARAWGAEDLTELERTEKILNAGVDQMGGEERTDLIIELVESGIISEDRIDESVGKLLREKFLLGLFDNPFVDPNVSVKIVGNEEFLRKGNEAQRRSFTLLTNNDTVLPLKPSSELKFYIEGFNKTFMEKRNLHVVDTTAEADMALIRLQAPYEPRPGGFEANMHAGSLEYNATEQARQAAIYKAVPTIVDIYLDRPAAIPQIVESAKALMGNYGASPDAFLDVVFNVNGAKPEGKLPFDLPRSMAAVAASREDVPFDTENPVFRYSHGLSYA